MPIWSPQCRRRPSPAVLDIFRQEPLPQDHPFCRAEGIAVLPHVGGLHPQRDSMVTALLVENLRRFAAGEKLKEPVDRATGYYLLT
jgi:phosphoglycerate dehydrogenase-like enzyme